MIKVTAKRVAEAKKGAGAVLISREYLEHDGLACRQTKSVIVRPDYPSGAFSRLSEDNGKTYCEWTPIEQESFSTMYGEDEQIDYTFGKVWNPHHGHYVATGFYRYYIDGRDKAHEAYWDRGEKGFFDHQTLRLFNKGEEAPFSEHLVMYEDGKEFDPENPRDMEYLAKNNGFENAPIILKNGDIAVPVGVPIHVGCRLAGLDVNKIFPSCPTLHRCVVVARGKYNNETNRYDLTFSNPIILSDLRSSRGIDEPILAELESGRILLVMRGSNVNHKPWNTRIEPATPSFKWYSYSDDGGATFTSAEPWHFDDREIIYSSATISKFCRSSKNGKLYWFGNITDHTAHGNWPRFPLCIAEVDDNTGLLIKESMTVIDTRREGETDRVQLSNFKIIEDRETLNFELSLCKLNQFDREETFWGEGWTYEIDVEA